MDQHTRDTLAALVRRLADALHYPCSYEQPPPQKQGRTTSVYNKIKQSRVQTRLSSGDACPALHAGSRSCMRPALVASTPMSTLLTTDDRA
jgi:hypothetical protein